MATENIDIVKIELHFPIADGRVLVQGPLTYRQDGLATQHNADFMRDPRFGDTILAVAEEFWDCTSGPQDPTTKKGRCSDAANVHFQGSRDLGDTMVLPGDNPP